MKDFSVRICTHPGLCQKPGNSAVTKNPPTTYMTFHFSLNAINPLEFGLRRGVRCKCTISTPYFKARYLKEQVLFGLGILRMANVAEWQLTTAEEKESSGYKTCHVHEFRCSMATWNEFANAPLLVEDTLAVKVDQIVDLLDPC